MKYILVGLTFFFAVTTFGQKPKKAIKKLGNDPVFFIDSVNVDNSELQKYNPQDIASVSVFKDSTAIKLIGMDGKDGVVYVETKAFARTRYWNFFRSKSPDYARVVPSPGSDSTLQYILNERVLKTNFEGDLSLIDDSIFKNLIVIDKSALEKQYSVTGKEYGIVITSDVPRDLYKGKKKF